LISTGCIEIDVLQECGPTRCSPIKVGVNKTHVLAIRLELFHKIERAVCQGTARTLLAWANCLERLRTGVSAIVKRKLRARVAGNTGSS
jgi:hypothetical protein